MSTDIKTPEQAAQFVRDCLYLGPAYKKLYALRRQRPELAHELDALAVALKETGDRIEEFVREQAAGVDGRDAGDRRGAGDIKDARDDRRDAQAGIRAWDPDRLAVAR